MSGCVLSTCKWLGFQKAKTPINVVLVEVSPRFQVAGWHLAMAFGANSKRIFLAEEMDGFRGAPEWLFWGWISRTADKL